MCVIAWVIALVRMVDPGELYSPLSKAEQRASTLLKEWLTREQCIQYQRLGYFEVRGSHSGKRYRIRPARQMNVDQLDERGRRVDVLCFLPEKYVPVSDVMLLEDYTEKPRTCPTWCGGTACKSRSSALNAAGGAAHKQFAGTFGGSGQIRVSSRFCGRTGNF